MKKILFLVGVLLVLELPAQEGPLLKELSASLSLTKKDPVKGLVACLQALNRFNAEAVLPASQNPADHFAVLPAALQLIRESLSSDQVEAQLLKHFDACRTKAPLTALQFLVLYESLSQEKLLSNDEWRPIARSFLFDNNWLMLYHYYGLGHYDVEGLDTERSYVLLSDEEWAEEEDFIKTDQDKLALCELSIDLAEYMSTDHYDIVDNSGYQPATYYAQLKTWGPSDLMAVWYNMLDAFEKGQLYKAILYGKMARNAQINDKDGKQMHLEFLQDYEMVTGTLFDPRIGKDSVSMTAKMGRTRLWKMFDDINEVARKKDLGTLTVEDINKSKQKVEFFVEKMKAKKYIDYGVYQYDMGYADMYKNYGARTEALFHLERLKQLDTLSFTECREHLMTLSEYADFHLQMAFLCFGLDDAWYERELAIVEQTIRFTAGMVPFDAGKLDGDPRLEMDFVALKNNVRLIHEFSGSYNKEKEEAITNRLHALQKGKPGEFAEVSVLLPNQFQGDLFVPHDIFLNWITATKTEGTRAFTKYASCGYPLVYGMNNLSLLGYLDDYHDLLKAHDRLYDFEPWYNYTFDLYEKISYTRSMCIDQFNTDLSMITLLNEKGYSNKVEHILAQWNTHTRHYNDTLSRTYAFTLGAETEYLEHKLSPAQKIRNARKYFDIVKIKGDCSQCYFTAALMLAGVYLEANDTTQAENIVQDLLQKMKTEQTIPNDLQSAVWKCEAEVLLARIKTRYKNKQSYQDLLAPLEKVLATAMPLDRTNEDVFYAGQVWMEMERKNYTGLASADRLWKFFKDEHQRYSKNSLLYTDKDRQEYFDGLLRFLDMVTWRYSLLPEENDDLAKNILSYTAYYKSFATGSFPAMKKYVMAKNDPALMAKWETWIGLRSGKGKRNVEDDFKEYKIEKEILSAMLRDSVLSMEQPVSFETLKTKLDDQSFLINVLTSGNELTGEEIYFAQVVHKKSAKPQYVYLGTAAELEEKGYTAYEKAMKTISAGGKDTVAYRYFWKPFEKIIPPKSKVYLLNDGVYHKINLGSVYDPRSKKYLCDQWNFQVIVKLDQVGQPSGDLGLIKAEIFGNPIFNLGYSGSAMTISSLQNTQQECETIAQILAGGQVSYVHQHTAETANEDGLKEIVQPTVLHIATHGFFVPGQEEEKEQSTFEGEVAFRSSTVDFVHVTDPLLRSGILLSGAENTLNGRNLSEMTRYREDGILTAREAMELNLDSTRLVVLSACETGLGEIIPGQSVAGLQNGFKAAGAGYLLLTLWSVDDQATRVFMEMFYTALVNNRDQKNAVENSFFEAQQKFKQLPQYAQPFFWGAFVLAK